MMPLHRFSQSPAAISRTKFSLRGAFMAAPFDLPLSSLDSVAVSSPSAVHQSRLLRAMAPPNNTSGMEFEVFLSFRGPDTRNNFTSCLYHDMVEKGIRVFKDDEELRIGQQIGGNLLRALDDTQIYIPIFSKGFAFSVWCLREVAHMVDCTSKSNGKKEILPIFFRCGAR